MKKNLISIIVPVYNTEKYLNKCIDSLINQTYKNIEIIIINDGSTDNSEKIIKKYKDKRIKYYKNSNQGIGKTRNFGIEKSNGEFIMFVDSDDFLDLEACEILHNKIIKEDLDLVVCDYYKIYDNLTSEEIKLENFENTSLKEKPQLINIINLSPWNKIYRLNLIKNNNIFFIENKKYEDVPFVTCALKKAYKIGKVNKPLNYYAIHSNSETTIRDRRCFDIFDILDIVKKQFIDDTYIKNELNKLIVFVVTNYTLQQRAQKDKNVAREFIDKAFDYLEENVPDYKNKKYYKGKNFIRRKIESNKKLTKIYCKVARIKYVNKKR